MSFREARMNAAMFDADFFQDPYPYYSALRSNQEPLRVVHNEGSYQRDFLLFSSYSDANTIFSQGHAVSKEIRAVRPADAVTPFDLHMLHRDEPDHLRLRRLVADYFSPSSMRRFEATVAAVAEEILQSFDGQEQVDLIADFAEPMPLLVMAKLLGLPASDLPRIRAWTLIIAEGFDSFVVAKQDPGLLRNTLAEFLDYAGAVLKRQQYENAREGLIAHLINAGAADKISDEELLGMMVFLLFAGHETTINLIGNGLWLLLDHPEQLALLRANPALTRGAVEEILRFESPEQRTSFRIATQPLQLGGYRLEPGQQFGVIIGAANRDEAEFPSPDRFIISRSPNRHLAFGAGMHNCLGKHLARLEARIALDMIFGRYPLLELVQEYPQWRKNSFFRGLETLPARFWRG